MSDLTYYETLNGDADDAQPFTSKWHYATQGWGLEFAAMDAAQDYYNQCCGDWHEGTIEIVLLRDGAEVGRFEVELDYEPQFSAVLLPDPHPIPDGPDKGDGYDESER